MNKVTVLALCSLAAFVGLAAQQPQTNKEPTSGRVTASVFLITKSGDLKPGRLADVTLFYFPKSGQTGKSPGEVYKNFEIKAMNRLVEKMTVDKLVGDEYCQADFEQYRTALDSTVEWASNEGRSGQVRTTQADEEGRFKITVPPGGYTIVVWGQAGMNLAFWETTITVTAGQTVAVKLSSPRQACVQQ